MISNRPRVFLGTSDTSSCLTALAKGFRSLGCSTTVAVTHPEWNTPGVQYDVMRGRPLLHLYQDERMPALLRGALHRLDSGLSIALNAGATPEYLDHDIFVLVAAPWAPAPALYPLLARLGKRLVVYHLGSDVRHVSAFSQEFGVDLSKLATLPRDPLDRKIQYIRWGELFADLVYSVHDQAGLQIRPYYHAHTPVDIDVGDHIPARVEPRIVHAPSRQDLKGTADIVGALDALRREGLRFDFQLLTGVPRTAVLEALRGADIVIDQLILHGPGVLGAEAMLAGCAVATRTLEPAPTCFAPPVCAIDRDNVRDRLRKLIKDVAYRTALAARGAAWARATFDPTRIAKAMLSRLEGEELPEYVPNFYLDRYSPPAPLSTLTRALSLRVAERFRPEWGPSLYEAAERGVVRAPSRRQALGGAVEQLGWRGPSLNGLYKQHRSRR